jgi:uncharacterized small protein (DUF1192 family)
MTKFNEKSLHSFPLAFYYSAIQAFDTRIGAVSTTLARFLEMRAEQHRLFLVFDEAYKQSLKSQSTKTIGDLDKVRDKIAFVIERVAKLWEEKLDFDDTLNIHGRRVAQAFKDFNFRAEEALVAENAKIRNIEQVFASADLTADLAAMGLTELNTRMAELTTQIEQLMSQRNEEQAVVIVGKLKAAREALDAQYRAFLTYLNAVQELQPEEGISQAAMFYNQDLYKVELQLAQSRKGGSASEKPATDGGTTPTTPDNPGTGDNTGGGGTTPTTPDTPSDPGTGGGDNTGGGGGSHSGPLDEG